MFTPSSPIADSNLLVGREQLRRRMVAALHTTGKSLVVVGGRAVGKTSLCRVVTGELGLPVFYRSLGREDTFDSVIVSLFERFDLAWRSEEIETTEALDKAAEVGIVGTGGKLQHRRETRQRIRLPSVRMSPDQLSDRLSQIKAIAVIDDFDILLEETCSAFSELIKKLSDHRSMLVLVLIGVAEDAADLVRNFTEVERHVEKVRVPPLEPDHLRLLMRAGLHQLVIAMPEADGISITPETQALILAKSLGFPHEVHRYCLDCGFVLCDRIDDGEKSDLTIGSAELELAERASIG